MEISNKIKRFAAYQLIKNHVSREEMEEIIERYPEEDFVYLERDNVERIIALLQGQQTGGLFVCRRSSLKDGHFCPS